MDIDRPSSCTRNTSISIIKETQIQTEITLTAISDMCMSTEYENRCGRVNSTNGIEHYRPVIF